MLQFLVMPQIDLKIRCQRCGEQMEMKDPAPDKPWQPEQFWVCPRCSRHFWTTYANPPVSAGTAGAGSTTPPAPEGSSGPAQAGPPQEQK
jgi:DNA-directed RNA polymerase subunit RPC12/RpoP